MKKLRFRKKRPLLCAVLLVALSLSACSKSDTADLAESVSVSAGAESAIEEVSASVEEETAREETATDGIACPSLNGALHVEGTHLVDENGSYTVSGNSLEIKNADYNGSLSAGGSAGNIGFIVSGNGSLSVE